MSPKQATVRVKRASTSKASATARAKSVGLTKREALRAVRSAKKAMPLKAGKLPAAWRPGGREYERALGHFGPRSKA